MKRSLYFHIGCTFAKESILTEIASLGYEVIVLDDVGKRSTDLSLEYHSIYSMEFAKVLELIEEIAKSRGLALSDCHFFTLAEGSVGILNLLLLQFKRDPISTRSDGLRNKFAIRRRLADTGFERLSVMQLATNPSDIPVLSKEAFPLIVKPVESMESRNVFRVQSQDELRRACLEIFSKNKTYVMVDHGEIVLEDLYGQQPFALIESALQGEKMSAEVVVHNGKRHFHCVLSKFDHDNDFFYERADILNPALTAELDSLGFSRYLDKLIESLDIRSSILHVEFFFDRTASKFNLIEVNLRLGGGHIHELVEKSYGFNLVASYLELIAANRDLEHFPPDNSVWVAFDFLSAVGGEFTPIQAEAFGAPIEWSYSKGEVAWKFTTSKFFKTGTVLFSATDNKQALKNCEHLTKDADQYFRLGNKPETSASVSQLTNLKDGKLKSDSLPKKVIFAVYLVTFLITCSYFYKTFVVQSEIISDTLAKTLSYHLSNGETYYVSNIVHNFESGNLFNRIVVTDKAHQVLYASSSEHASYAFYQSVVKSADYERQLPIVSDGITIGYLYYDVNYRLLLLRLGSAFLLMSLFATFLYYTFVRYLFKRMAASAKREANQLISVMDAIKQDLEGIQNNNGVSFEKYSRLLTPSENDHDLFGSLRKSLLRLVLVFRELRDAIVEKRRLSDLLDESTKKLFEATTRAAMGSMADQVSHDIRSPLSALNMVVGSLHDLPEDKRLIIRNAVQRINDIANGLLKQSVDSSGGNLSRAEGAGEPVMLVALLDSIVSEKRIQYRNRMEIEIQGDLALGYGLFANIDTAEFSRVFSNLINNSVEAMSGSGRVTVAIEREGENVVMSVEDTGKGIPSDILWRIGERGFTYGKERFGGSGLGIHHAVKTVRLAGGDLRVDSQLNRGTLVTLSLPRAEIPSWFVDKVSIRENTLVVSIDDDQTIHQIWSGRLRSSFPTFDHKNHVMFSSLDNFEEWLQSQSEESNFNTFYLMDYEFIDQSVSGLGAIAKMGIQNRSILVSSRVHEPQVQSQAKRLGVKMLPKSLAPLVPIEILEANECVDAILIDDDHLMRMTWEMAAREHNKKIRTFDSEQSFLLEAKTFDPGSPLYIDVSLGPNERGEDVAHRAAKAGFRNISLATGYERSSITRPPGVRAIIGKEPPFSKSLLA